MAGGSSTQNNQNTGTGGGVLRDVNASLGSLDLGSSTATAHGGEITLGSVYSGETSGTIGLGKILIFTVIGFVAYIVLKKV